MQVATLAGWPDKRVAIREASLELALAVTVLDWQELPVRAELRAMRGAPVPREARAE